MRIYVGFGLIFSTWIAVLLSILLGCRPLEKNWQIYPDPGSKSLESFRHGNDHSDIFPDFCQPAISKIDIFVTVVLNVLTDIYLLSIPIPMLWQSSLKSVKKAGLILLFSGGIFVTMAGILRCVLILTDPVNGAQQAGSWAVRETFVAVVTSNLPMIFPLVHRWGKPIISSIRTFSTTGGKMSGMSRSGDPKPGAFRLEDKNPRRGMGPRSVNPITEFTMNGSEEYIVDPQNRGAQQPYQTAASTNGSDTDVEAGVATAVSGGILKETSLRVSEMRKSQLDSASHEPDYYLVQQSRESNQTANIHHENGSRKAKRSSVNFSLSRGI